ncbi:carbohydrate ABC transporter permease [Eubacteriales bacterium OttesenSCG-928-A19]|nr:carbohydrate ABC transporter permease [Eubacteriales bacterium OttesenSCG-928-A19]
MEKHKFATFDRTENLALTILSDVVKIIVMLMFVFPFYWMIITAFKPYVESMQVPPTLWPQTFSLEGYINTFNSGLNIPRFMLNTVIVTCSVICLQLVVMVPAAYAFAKRKFPLSGIAFGVVLVAFMIPQQLTYIPIYLMMAKAKLINSLWPQIIPFGADAFGIFMLRQSFKQIPDEIVESAKLDSAGEIKIMLKIMLPMCKSAIVTIAMFSFIGTWNSYFWPLVMTQNDLYRPLTLAIERLRDMEIGIRWNTLMAGNSLLVVPILIVFIFASRKIIEGFTYRGVK